MGFRITRSGKPYLTRLLFVLGIAVVSSSCTSSKIPSNSLREPTNILKETSLPSSQPKPTPASNIEEKPPSFSNTTWAGVNFEGERYEVTFHVEGHVAKGFTVKTPTRMIHGYGFYFVGQPEKHERLDLTSYGFALEFLMNNARLGGEIFGDEIIFKDVAPLVVAIDYKALLGDSYKGRQSISEHIDCEGQTVGAFVVFEANSKRARESFEDGLLYEQDERPPKNGPYGLGEASYYKWIPWPDHVPELHFIRKNVLFYFPAGYVQATPAVKKRIYQIAYTLDAAVRDENPAVTIIRMPKRLKKISPAK